MFTKNDYEKQIANSIPALDEKNIEIVTNDMITFLNNSGIFKYIMLLSNEINYYTIFDIISKQKTIFDVILEQKTTTEIANEIMNFIRFDPFLTTLGELKLIETNPDHIEIWIGETYFSLFICDSFIVKV